MYDEFHFPKISILPEPVLTYSTAFPYAKGFPLRHQFDEITQRLVEGGFPNLWFKNFLNPTYKINFVSKQYVKEAFGLDNLEGAFWIFIMCLGFSLSVFVLEVFCTMILNVWRSHCQRPRRILACLEIRFEKFR